MKAALFALRLNELLGGALHLYFGRFTSMSQNLKNSPLTLRLFNSKRNKLFKGYLRCEAEDK
jgi:hypothetical protein